MTSETLLFLFSSLFCWNHIRSTGTIDIFWTANRKQPGSPRTLRRRVRDIIEGQSTQRLEETLKSSESFREVLVLLSHCPRLNCLMKRQLWRLLELHDCGRSLGFMIEFSFLALS